jgi:uncharacterized membrane protein
LASKFNVVYTGLQDNVTDDEFVNRFCKIFNSSEEKAIKIAAADSEVVIKKELDENKAKQYKNALTECGANIRLDKIPQKEDAAGLGSGLSLEPIEEQKTSENNTVATDPNTCPKCGSDQISGDECLACGIYISKYLESRKNVIISEEEPETPPPPPPPQSEGLTQTEDLSQTENSYSNSSANNPYATPEANLVDNEELYPEKVAAGSGIQWLGRGFWHFKQSPLGWIGAIVVFIILFLIISLIPLIGSIATNLLSPVIIAGLLLGAQEQDEGGDFKVSHLFAGFSNNAGQLILVGLFYMLAIFAIVMLMMLFMGSSVMMFAGDGSQMPADIGSGMTAGMYVFMIVGFILMILVFMAYYFAPVLVALEGLSAFEAMKLSFSACLKNWLTFLIYGILLTVLIIVAAIPVGLGLLIAIPMINAAMYVSYRDIFHHNA